MYNRYSTDPNISYLLGELFVIGMQIARTLKRTNKSGQHRPRYFRISRLALQMWEVAKRLHRGKLETHALEYANQMYHKAIRQP